MTFDIDLVVAKGHELGQSFCNIDVVDFFENLFGNVLRWINLVFNFVVNRADQIADVTLAGDEVFPAVVFEEISNIVKCRNATKNVVEELIDPSKPCLPAGSILGERGKFAGAKTVEASHRFTSTDCLDSKEFVC